MQEKLVVIFGGGGFLGRYVAQELLSRGARVRIAQRDPSSAMHVRTLGDLGQTQFVGVDISKADNVARAIHGADAVVNLVGILHGAFHKVHVEGAANIAKAAAQADAKALVHVSAIGADTENPSAYGRSKGQGEAAVRAAFPDATIIRPSIIFGQEDQFLNRFAQIIRAAPLVPVIGARTRFQPVFVADVGRAIALAAMEPREYGGQTFELGGPEIMSMRQVNEWIAKATGRRKHFIDVPDSLAGAIANLTGWLPCAPITADQWKMLQRDNVVSEGAKGLAQFDITPTPLAAVASHWLVQYRRHGRFSDRTEA